MKYSIVYSALPILASFILPSCHSLVGPLSQQRRTTLTTTSLTSPPIIQKTALYETSNADADAAGDESGPNLVDKDVFLAAVDTLRTELANQQQPEHQPLPKKNDADDDDKTFYAIGKVKINLDVSSGAPGMDLAESTGGLVLVSSVTGHALTAGIQTGDTIVAVTAAGAFQETKAYSLEDTARVLMGAMKFAVQNGTPEIELELNRLIKMRYA